MADTDDMTDWLPGQPPPWLDLYGPAPGLQPLMLDAGRKGGVSVPSDPTEDTGPLTPAPTPAPAPPPTGKTTLGPRGRNSIGETSAPATDETPGPSAEFGGRSVADLQQQAQVAGGPQPFVPPWLQALEQPNPPAPIVPDAISGGAAPAPTALTPDQSLARIAVDPNAALQDRQKAWRDMAPEQRTQLVNNADPKALAALATADMDPADLAAIAVRHQQAQLHEQSAQQLALAQKADEDARANYATYQSAVQQANTQTGQLEADAQKLSQEKIDPNEHGVLHFLASVFTAGIGGAASPYTGGRNLALEELDKQSQRRIAAQQADLENRWKGIGIKRNLIGEQLQRSGDLFHATAAYQVSQYDRAIAELQTKMQDYDPQGTTALRAAGAMQQVQAQRAATLQAYNQQVLKNKLDIAKAQNEIAQQQETVRHNKATEGLEYSKFGLESQKAAAELQTFTPEQLGALYPGAPVPPVPMSQKQYTSWLETTSKGQEAVKASRENTASDMATAIHDPNTGKPYQQNGVVVRAASPDIADKINEQTGYTQAFLDRLGSVRRELASSPSAFDKEAYARIRTNMDQALQDYAQANGLKYTTREKEALEGAFGTDYKDFKDRYWSTGKSIASIDQLIKNTMLDANTRLKARYGYTGPTGLVDTSQPAEAAPIPTDDALKQLSALSPEDTGDPVFQLNHELDKVGRDTPEGKRALALTIAPSRLRILDNLFQQAQAGDQNALAALQTVAEGKTANTSKSLRSYAQSLVSSALGSTVLDDKATPAPEAPQ